MRPKLTAEAAEEISSTYCHLRSLSDQTREKTLPITARTLENLIRLSTAHAKARLSQTIEQVFFFFFSRNNYNSLKCIIGRCRSCQRIDSICFV